MTELTPGSTAPDFELQGENGALFRRADYSGKKLVLYFYPKDDTSGCTKEAVGFSEALDRFAAADTEVLGVSKDSVEKHAKFRQKYDLTIPLGSDPEGRTIEAYGAWVEKSMYGRKYMGIDRSTFLIGRDGKIARIWRKVKVPDHVDEVLKASQSLD